jgi:hypothetical protein
VLVHGRGVTEGLEKRLFQGRPDLEQLGVPFTVGADVGESPVVQLVADVEGELEIVSERGGRGDLPAVQ